VLDFTGKVDTGKSTLIVMTHWNYWKMTQGCIDSIRKYTNLDDVSILIIDDFSDDEESIKWAKESKENIIRTNFNYHHNSILRQLLEYVKDIDSIKYICAMNNDIVVTKNWLKEMLICIDKDLNLALMGCKDNNDYHLFQYFPIPQEVVPDVDRWRGFIDDSKFQEYINREFYAKRKSGIYEGVQTIDGSVMLIRNSFIKQYGGFNEDFDDYAGDSEFFLKIVKAQHGIGYCLSSFVYHVSGGGAGKYESWLKSRGTPLDTAAVKRTEMLKNLYGVDITSHGRSYTVDVEQIRQRELELVKL